MDTGRCSPPAPLGIFEKFVASKIEIVYDSIGPRAATVTTMRTCKTCSHPDVKKINADLVRKVTYRKIAEKYTVPASSVSKHAINHVKPLIKKAEAKVKKALTEKIVSSLSQYRDEVHLEPMEKVRLLQQKILNALDDGFNRLDFVPLLREFRGTIQEEAKLLGAYQKERSNDGEIDLIVTRYIARLEAAGFTKTEIDVAVRENFPQVMITSTVQ